MTVLADLLERLAVRAQLAVVISAGITLLVSGLLTYDATAGPIGSPGPILTQTPSASATQLATIPERTPEATSLPSGLASRIVIPAMGIDLPVVEAPEAFPYCNVAQYVKEFSQPGHPGSTVIGAHARVGMFLPLLTASKIDDGAAMVGMLVEVYTSDDRLYLYEIDLVLPHQLDYSIAALPPGVSQQLVVVTSEGNRYTKPKLMLRGRLLFSTAADHALANPAPHIVICQ